MEDVAYTVLLNQTAIHGVPAALNAANSALLRAWTGRGSASIRLDNHPLPTLSNEDTVRVNQMSGNLLMVLCVTMAAAVLSASFVVFLVREAESRSKHVQVVSGAPLTAYWASTYLWDLVNFTIPVAGIVLCFYAFDLPQFRGPRMAAVLVLFLCFGAAALPLTYLLAFYFSDEMRALQVLNTFFFMTGYLGFLSTWIMDTIGSIVKNATLEWWNSTIKGGLMIASPHFVLARGIYDISQTYRIDQGLPNTNPFRWHVSGRMFSSCGIQAVVYMALTLAVDFRVGPLLCHLLYRRWHKVWAARPGGDSTQRDYQHLDPAAGYRTDLEAGGVLPGEDTDVAAERRRIQSGGKDYQVLLDGIQKSYPRHSGQPPLKAVAGLWLGIGRGECFGLLGLNGAGKTTTFSILTGEITADEGDAAICGRSVRGDLHAAQQHTGYCPQFDGLPGLMTGRELLRMYARLRGMPPRDIDSVSTRLVARLGLAEHIDKTCDSCSGGTRRKLAVAVALMGSPQVILMDEPSTGMDPAARHFLWTVLQRQVVQAGHTVVLTSHSMEECEALCTRIGIMASGRLACLGSVQHLKNRFGVGYMLDMRVEASRRDDVIAMVIRVSPHSKLTLKGGGHLSFALPSEDLDLPSLFEMVEDNKDELGIQEYSLSQTTLEQVFVNLAEHEAEDRAATDAAVNAVAAAADAEEANHS